MDQQQQQPPPQGFSMNPTAAFSQMMGGPMQAAGLGVPGARGGLEGLMGAMNLNPHPMGGLISDQRGAMPTQSFIGQQQQQATNEETARGIMEAVGSNLSSNSGPAGGEGAAGRQTPFDASDFPSLMDSSAGGGGAGGGSAGRFGPLGSQASAGFGAGAGGRSMGAAAASDPYTSLQFGMLRHKHGGNQNGEFSIQNEEFPALGGGPRGAAANTKGKGDSQDNSNSSGGNSNNSFLQPYGQVMGGQPMGGMGMGMGMGVGGAGPQQPQPQQPTTGGDGGDAGDKGTGGSTGGKKVALADDKFGLLGLLNVIRMSNADLTTLALGMDLTSLGLNLNSPGSLYKSFTSPWSDNPQGLPAEPDFKVPQCYLQVPSMLQPGSIKSFPLETLFYMFYSMCAEEGQVLAAEELWSRGWCYHREHKLWLARVPNTEPVVKTDRYERGSFLVFDSMAWDIVRKDNFVLQYQSLEQSLSARQQQQPPFQQQQQQQQVKA